MQIYINKNGQQIGPFTEYKVAEMLQNGQISPNDSAIRQGESQWTTLAGYYVNTLRDPTLNLNESLRLGQIPVNIDAENWANKFFGQDIKATPSTLDTLGTVAIILSSMFSFGFISLGILGFINEGSQGASTNFTLILLGAFATILPLAIWIIFRYMKSRQVGVLNKVGVKTRKGKLFYWKNLTQIHYSYSQDSINRRKNNQFTWYFSLLPKSSFNPGNNSLIIELFFTTGKVIVHPYLFEQKVMAALLQEIPTTIYLKSKRKI